ncbi:helix-turn-helix transcriptional regulator [Streptomyces sp. NPDC014983]|uniref:helix-turn-helix transcriptional regulator n=1 Tax=Streptomyces sp. NPDC014983 TaxID=3364933 RepID=UPI0036F978FE
MHTPDHQANQAPRSGFPAPDSDPAVVWRNLATLLFDRIPLPVAYCDAAGTVLTVNQAMASEWGTLPSRLIGRRALDLFRPAGERRLDPISEALRLRRRSRYPIEVSWSTKENAERHGEMIIDLVGDAPNVPPNLLLILHARDEPTGPAPARPEKTARVSDMEKRILARVATGQTSARIATEVGLTPDGVNYHLARLSRRWGVANRAALVARAYTKGVLAPCAWPPVPAGPPPPH